MRLITIVSLGASGVLGVAALFVARAMMPSQAQATTAAAVMQSGAVAVVVASRPIAFGDTLDAAHLTVARLPANAAPEGAFATIAQVLAQDHGGAPVALVPISAREAVLPPKLSGPGARASVAAEIAEGLRAYTIKVTDVSGVGGHALPGDRVDVVLMRDIGGGGDPNARNVVSQVVLQNVRVLGVDLNADLTSNKPATPNTATLEVSVQDAQKLAAAAELGTLSLALRPSGAAEVQTVGTVQSRDFISRPAGAAPRQSGPRRPAATAPQRGRLIVIVDDDAANSTPSGG